jgi:hypothetical protein
LLSSSQPPAGQPPAGQPQRPPDAARNESAEAPERTQARKLEQLKDLYLTAEAIGEQNVDKHFDQLLARQRELISEYFKQSAAPQAGPASPGVGQVADAGPEHQQTGGEPTPPEGLSLRAVPPRAW